ncbi:N-acetylmuramoyl-L-alanine amidase [Thermocrinis minervae]|uniref:N-acetylmuramoyl-L-alanine amidase n=1 Tax=Thermocrinis minervae TaxID=381751 RepID=A0A1M6SQE6_9AQUI|nr:N-acetylmuramoyl-L-alanine amidase [Thermocrinis minervae]SHK46943.1 N-acetylmuramoyl-L-alanine amidase [Thermocrinis minervae]
MFLAILILNLIISFGFAQNLTVRYGSYPEKERLVFEFKNRVDYKILQLKNPNRMVIDLFDFKGQISSLPKHVKVRVGKHPWGTRLVVEGEFSDVKAFSLEDPFRIVVDLYREKSQEEDNLIAILDPDVLKVLNNTKGNERVVEESVKGKLITQRRVIVLDAGHGGHDPGAIGFMGIKEKDITLAIVKKLATYLEQDGRFKVFLTRNDDYFVPLQERAKIAIKKRADLFISIHANASDEGITQARGTEIFAISSSAAQVKKTQIVKNKEYAKLVLGDSDIPTDAKVVLADLAMDVTLYESVNFAKLVAKELSSVMQRNITYRGTKRAGFAVLKTPGIPSVLIEVGFINNKDEAILMASENFQKTFAYALYKAIVRYFFPKQPVNVSLNL